MKEAKHLIKYLNTIKPLHTDEEYCSEVSKVFVLYDKKDISKKEVEFETFKREL